MKSSINIKKQSKTKELKPNKKTLEALKENETILKELKEGKRKGYTNMTDLINSLNKD